MEKVSLTYKNGEERYEQIIDIRRKMIIRQVIFLDYVYFSKRYKLIAIDLSKQIELQNSDLKQQINFIGRPKRDEGEAMFFIIEKLEETIFEYLQNGVTVV